ncbi:hypothetical protein ACMYSQ_004924 [Aspergillus niger]
MQTAGFTSATSSTQTGPFETLKMSISECCIKGFRWNDTPTGRTDTLGPNAVYITGSNPDIAILFIPDLYGWTFPNVRLLADHFATEINATVFVPDFFGGEILDFDLITTNQFSRLDLPGFLSRNGRTQREPEIFEFARRLRRELGFRRIGAVGYCYGGWASFRLGAAEHANEPLVDCISIGHPSLLLKEDIENVAVPVQVLAPEIDAAYTAELKTYTFETLQRRQVVFDYQHFPGVEHSCFIRGDINQPGERAAMDRGKNAAVAWFRQHLAERAQ